MIGIVTPINRSEVSAAAFTLADFLSSRGISVVILSPDQEIVEDSHPVWSRRVERARLSSFAKLSRRFEKIIWFNPQRQLVRKVKSGTENILVFRRTGFCNGDLRFYHRYFSKILYNCSLVRDFLLTQARFELGTELPNFCDKLHYVSWESGLENKLKQCQDSYIPSRYVFFCGKSSIDLYGVNVLQIIHWLLLNEDSCEVKLVAMKSWNKRDRKLIAELREEFNSFTAVDCSDIYDQCQVFSDADWCIFPDTKIDYGIFLLRALSCGTPVIAHRDGLVSEIVRHERNGLLVESLPYPGLNSLNHVVLMNVSGLKEIIRMSRSSFLYKKLVTGDFRIGRSFDQMNKNWSRVLDLGES